MSIRSSAEAPLVTRVRGAIRDVPEFPAPGILFRDVTPLLAAGSLFREVTVAMAAPFVETDVQYVVGIESRGFIFGAPVAQQLGAGFIPMRKKGKLPGPTVSRPYGLEYGTDELELQSGACAAGSRVLIVDDVLATGGTALVAAQLVEAIGASVVGFSFLIALEALDGGRRLQDYEIRALLRL